MAAVVSVRVWPRLGQSVYLYRSFFGTSKTVPQFRHTSVHIPLLAPRRVTHRRGVVSSTCGGQVQSKVPAPSRRGDGIPTDRPDCARRLCRSGATKRTGTQKIPGRVGAGAAPVTAGVDDSAQNSLITPGGGSGNGDSLLCTRDGLDEPSPARVLNIALIRSVELPTEMYYCCISLSLPCCEACLCLSARLPGGVTIAPNFPPPPVISRSRHTTRFLPAPVIRLVCYFFAILDASRVATAFTSAKSTRTALRSVFRRAWLADNESIAVSNFARKFLTHRL